jgi:hypothetical protein
MKLIYEYEKKDQLIVISTIKNVKSRCDAEDLGYDDFEAFLLIDGKPIADISPVLAKSPAWQAMIDDIDWVSQWAEMKALQTEYQTEMNKYE